MRMSCDGLATVSREVLLEGCFLCLYASSVVMLAAIDNDEPWLYGLSTPKKLRRLE